MTGEIRLASLIILARRALRPGSKGNKRLVALLAAASFVKWWFKRVWAPSLNNRKVIFLGPGCGHVAYTLGFLDALLANADIRQAMVETGATFGGVSSGAQAAGFAMAALNGVLTMKEWYRYHLRKGFELLREHSPLAMGAEMEKAGENYYAICKQHLGTHPPWLDNFVVSFTGIFSLQPIFYSKFESARDMAEAICGSSFVPFVMGPKAWIWLSSMRQRVFDGYLGLWSARFPDNYMYVSFLHTVPKTVLRNKYYLRAYEYDRTNENVLIKSYPWGNPEWADAAFERGHKDFVDAGTPLHNKILEFLKA